MTGIGLRQNEAFNGMEKPLERIDGRLVTLGAFSVFEIDVSSTSEDSLADEVFFELNVDETDMVMEAASLSTWDDSLSRLADLFILGEVCFLLSRNLKLLCQSGLVEVGLVLPSLGVESSPRVTLCGLKRHDADVLVIDFLARFMDDDSSANSSGGACR